MATILWKGNIPRMGISAKESASIRFEDLIKVNIHGHYSEILLKVFTPNVKYK
ncbi:MAG TPA: hypothetical protein PLT50_02195 [bacterium]|nr:hypothetical protein [bacterium]